MTDREKAIVMAYTGICMLEGYKFQIFHKYVEDIMGRPIMTHEMGWLADTIKEKSKADFMALCADESSSEKPNKWIPVSEKLPGKEERVLTLFDDGFVMTGHYIDWEDGTPITWVLDGQEDYNVDANDIIAWMPLPAPFEPQESEEV